MVKYIQSILLTGYKTQESISIRWTRPAISRARLEYHVWFPWYSTRELLVNSQYFCRPSHFKNGLRSKRITSRKFNCLYSWLQSHKMFWLKNFTKVDNCWPTKTKCGAVFENWKVCFSASRRFFKNSKSTILVWIWLPQVRNIDDILHWFAIIVELAYVKFTCKCL